ncbi:MAG TPA: hypothetical protein VGF30_03685, partial [Bacteroidia bacterium]
LKIILLTVTPLMFIQLVQWKKKNLLAPISVPPYMRGIIYSILLICIMIFGVREDTEFIYFQF